jgi:hypothetical protein
MLPAQFPIVRHRARAYGRGAVLAKWGRELRTVARFPVQFRTTLDAAPFSIISFFMLFYAVAPFLGTAASSIKYLFTALQMSCFALLVVARQRVNLSPLFPVAALLLAVAGGISLTYSIALAPGTTSYASALIPLIVAAIPLVIPSNASWADGAAVTEYLFRIFGVASLFHVLWQAADYSLGLTEKDPAQYSRFVVASTMLVDFMILAGLFRRGRLLALSIAVIGLSLALRPSSTLGFSAIFATAVVALYRLRYRRIFRLACIIIAGATIVGNLAILENEDVASAVYSIEPLLKEDAFESISNNEFRLGIISAVRDEMAEQSLLVGKFFTGDVNVSVRKYLGRWMDEDQAPIHSDFILMVQQGGLIGYGLFATLLIGMARLCAKAARLAHAAGDSRSETLFDAVQAMNVVFMLYISANPTMQSLECALPYLMLVPVTIFLARAQPGSRPSAARWPRASDVALRAPRARVLAGGTWPSD